MKVSVNLVGERLVIRTLEGMRLDAPPFYREVGIYMERSLRRGIASERDIEGRPYAPLAPRTVNARRGGTVRGRGHILVDNGDMQKAIVSTPSSDSVRIGYGDRRQARKGFFHQFGTRRMPARSNIGIRQYEGHDDVAAIERIAAKHTKPER